MVVLREGTTAAALSFKDRDKRQVPCGLRMKSTFLPLPPAAVLTSHIPVTFFTQKEKHQSEHADREHICNLTQAFTDHNCVQLQADGDADGNNSDERYMHTGRY